jgi:hypothetical protein
VSSFSMPMASLSGKLCTVLRGPDANVMWGYSSDVSWMDAVDARAARHEHGRPIGPAVREAHVSCRSRR